MDSEAGNPITCMTQRDESLGRSSWGMQPRSEIAAPKRRYETRCRPSRGTAWLRGSMVRQIKVNLALREIPPLSPNISLHSRAWKPGYRGQHVSWRHPLDSPAGTHAHWRGACESSTVHCLGTVELGTGQRHLPCTRVGFRRARIGAYVITTYTSLQKSFCWNVGELWCDVKGCSRPMHTKAVGAVIVLRGRESLPHGEGPQSVGISMQTTHNIGELYL
jgi:hypothetical protein